MFIVSGILTRPSFDCKPNLELVNYETLYFETLCTCTMRNFMSTGRSSSYEREQKDINNNNNIRLSILLDTQDGLYRPNYN